MVDRIWCDKLVYQLKRALVECLLKQPARGLRQIRRSSTRMLTLIAACRDIAGHARSPPVVLFEEATPLLMRRQHAHQRSREAR
jgi:hypothetical protein